MLAAGVVVVAAVVTVNVVETRSATALRERITGLPGVVDGTLAHPVEEVWSRSGVQPVTTSDGVLAVRTVDGGLEGLDLETGEVRWATPSLGGPAWCDGVPDAGAEWYEDGAETLLCTDAGPAAGTAVLVHTASGQEAGRLELPTDRGYSWRRAGDVLVLSYPRGPSLEVVAWDLVEGTERWRWLSEPGVRPDDVGMDVWPDGVRLARWPKDDAGRPVEDFVAWIDLATGAASTTDPGHPGPQEYVVDLAGGWQTVTVVDHGGRSGRVRRSPAAPHAAGGRRRDRPRRPRPGERSRGLVAAGQPRPRRRSAGRRPGRGDPAPDRQRRVAAALTVATRAGVRRCAGAAYGTARGTTT